MRKLSVLILLLLLTLFPAIYASSKNNTLIYLGSEDIINFDPGLATDVYSSQIISNIFEGLTRYKKTSPDIEPCLAEKWYMLKNGKSWIFKIRKGIRFHNGEILDSTAVVDTFEKRLDDKEKFKEWNTFYTYIKKVRKVDKYSVEFVLTKPYAPFLFQLASPKSSIIAPSSYVKNTFDPLGTGPFKLSNRKKDKFVKLIRNDSYWGQRIYLSSIVFKVVPNTTWRILQMKNGKADVAFLDSGIHYHDISGSKILNIKSVPSASVHYLAFNVRKGPFKSRKMRMAVAHLINKDIMIKNIFQDFALNATTPVPPRMFGHNPYIKDYEFDIGKAKKLKEEAGYYSEIEVSLYYSKNQKNLENIAGKMKKAAKKIGIVIKKMGVPFSDLINIGYDKHDMLMLGWVGDIPDADVYLYPNFSENSGRLNRSGYINADLTKLLIEGRRITDRRSREKIYMDAQEIIHKDLPWISLYHLNSFIIHNKNVKNLTIQPLSFLNFREVFFERPSNN